MLSSKSYVIHETKCLWVFFAVAEFINKVCLIKEHAATQLLQAVETFRKKGNDIKKERYMCVECD